MAVFYSVAQETWSKASKKRVQDRLCCDAFGPYEVRVNHPCIERDEDKQVQLPHVSLVLHFPAKQGVQQTAAYGGDQLLEKGFGPALMRYRKDVAGFRLFSCVIRLKKDRCLAYALLAKNDNTLVRRKFPHNHRPLQHLPSPLDLEFRLSPVPSLA
ncbi:hypothetical protein BIW11_13327 [Tropilaelaps mercedesae]|uniref:Uncharacterized protein n=1 Tax=Tropilaelaps mercedesae TaxID=418985 RepID=A0A1V9X2P5_9ACAR|nr:hypothetical protein BIW11_13327 [Tropilaelaps mercedesae]